MKKLLLLFLIITITYSCQEEKLVNDRDIVSDIMNDLKIKIKKLRESGVKDFPIEEINTITKIIMTDKTGVSVILKKEGEGWRVNDKYTAWQDRIDYTLQVMKDIRIKSSVPEASEQMVIKNLAAYGVKIEIYTHNYLAKTYYIGGNTKDHLGTYMMIKESSTPFIMHIPDRQPGILNPKFGLEGHTVNETIWRKPITISISPIDSIERIIVKDFIDRNQSFSIDMNDKNLFDVDGKKIHVDKTRIDLFSSSFQRLDCGIFKPDLKKSNFILSKKIYITHHNRIDSLTIYDKTDAQKTKKEFNPTVENLYATWNNSDIVIIQKNIFNKVLITLDEFIQ